jgi:hypothetical protein
MQTIVMLRCRQFVRLWARAACDSPEASTASTSSTKAAGPAETTPGAARSSNNARSSAVAINSQ